MSFKDGIPLLAPFDDEDTEEEDDFAVGTLPHRRKKFNKKHIVFCFVVFSALFLLLALVVGVTVPVVLVQQDNQGGTTDGGKGGTVTGSVSVATIHSSLANTPTSSQLPGLSQTPSVSKSVSTVGVSPSTSSVVVSSSLPASKSLTPSPSTSSTSSVVVSSSLPASISLTPSPSTSSTSSVVISSSLPASKSLTPSPITSPTSSVGSSMVLSSSSVQLSPILTSSAQPAVSNSTLVMATSNIAMTTTSIVMTTTSIAMTTSAPVTVSPSLTLSHTQTPIVSMTPTPIPPQTNFYKSELDDRSYSLLTLENRLRVLLISDPNTNISAASMDVATGSFDDPDDVEGLAHFCEHMLFLGTEKYPEDGEYSQYLSQHGGYDNAFTSTQNTNYYFTVQSDYLEHALDMFAQFFISPLFTSTSVDREKNAVNAEHEKNILSDSWRMWELLKNVSNPLHPFHKFSTGSLVTLDRPDLLQQLKNFYHSRYSANTMQLVVYGRDNLSTLSDWVNFSFKNISDRNLSPTPHNTTSYPPPFNGRIIYYYPVADSNLVTIFWQVPSLEKKYRNAMSAFIIRYLGQKDEGSVLNYLKRNEYATSLSAGTEFDTDTYTLLYVQIELTDSGLNSVSTVIQAVSSYVELLREIPEGDFSDYFKEFQSVQQTVFDYGEREKPQDYVVDIAGKMRVVVGPEDFLSSPKRFTPNYSLFRDVLDCMHPANATIFIGTHQLNISPGVTNVTGINSTGLPQLNQGTDNNTGHIPWPVELTKWEDIYKIPYDDRSISSELANFWNMSSSDFSGFKLPRMNEYAVKNLTVHDKPINSSTVPVAIHQSQGKSLWWLQDTRDFPEPRVNFMCDIITTNAMASPDWKAKSQLFTSNVKAVLTTLLYSATEVGYTFDLSPTPRGISLSLSGLSNHGNMKSILKKISLVLSGYNMSDLYEATKHGALEDLNNYNFTALPFRYVYRYIQRVLMERPYWKHWEVYNGMVDLMYESVQSFADTELVSDISLLCYAHGNIDQDQALEYIDSLEDSLKSKFNLQAPSGQYPRSRVQLVTGQSAGVTMQTLNPEDENSVVNILFQVGETCTLKDGSGVGSVCNRTSLLTRLHLLLLQQIIGSECFHVLRTQQQLGYVVFCFSTSNEGTGSFQVVVQSQTYNASVVYDRITTFLKDYHNNTLLDQGFNATWYTQVDVLKSTLEQRDLTLGDRTNRLWGQVSSGQLQFDYNQQMVEIIRGNDPDFSPQSFLEFYSNHILNVNSSARKLLIVVYGQDKEFELPGEFNEIDYTNFNRTINYFD